MNCPKCKGDNVQISFQQTEGKAKKTGVGLGGHAHNAIRGVAAIGTLGMSNLVIKKAKGEEKMTYKNEKMAVCQDCGHSWKVK